MEKPVALITAFSQKVLPRILKEIAHASQPPLADWFVGTYGINQGTAELIADTPGCRYAPVFGIQPHTSAQARQRRPVPPDVASQLDPARAGEIPGGGDVLPPRERRAWGIELGRRFRDQMRTTRGRGIHIDTWQFDEVLGECGSSEAHRDFVGGVLRGLADGRPALHDRKEKGFVWAARTAITRLPTLPIAGNVAQFWEDLDRAALFLVGEEYPVFDGDPGATAREFASGHCALVASSGPVRQSLGRRYVVGMSPGWLPRESGLGGNLDARPADFVATWREGFIAARIAVQQPRGYAQFNFVKANARPNRVRDAVGALHQAAQRHAR